jgi:HTH-type transcriptional regulator, competence development regulator
MDSVLRVETRVNPRMVSLRIARGLRGLTLRHVAEAAEISPTYLQRLERGDVRDPSPHVLRRISKALNIPYGFVMHLAGYGDEDSDSTASARLEVEQALEGLSAQAVILVAPLVRLTVHELEEAGVLG